MKKKILLLLFMFLSTFHVIGQIQKSDLSKMDIKGNVKMLVERNYIAKEKFGIFQKERLSDSTVYCFNPSGFLIDKIKFLQPSEAELLLAPDKRETHVYNEKGEIVESNFYYAETPFTINSQLILTKKRTNIYNDKGKLIESNVYTAETPYTLKSKLILKSKSIYIYDVKGVLTECNDYTGNGNLESKIISKLNAKGNPVEYNYYNGDGSLSAKRTNAYDSKGVLITINEYDKNGLWLSSEKFDARGNAFQKTINNKVVFFAKFNLQGKRIETSYYDVDGSPTRKEFSRYDANGNEIENLNTNIKFKELNPDSKRTNKYEYDKNKNWITQYYMVYKECDIIDRNIIYYEPKK